MAGPADEVDRWLAGLSDDVAAALADEFAAAVEQEMVQPIRAAAPVGATGHLRESVWMEPGRDQFEWLVVAGGALTTKYVGKTGSYRREVVIPAQGDAEGYAATQGILKGGNQGVTYDYALAVEFGTSKMPAQPFFWPTVRVQMAPLQQRVQRMLDDYMGKGGR